MKETEREKREIQRKREKKREIARKREKKREKERKRERKDVQGQLLSIFIQFSKGKTKYIGRNAQNLKKLPPRRPVVAHYHYKSSCRS